jgi:hypothetical protein
MSPVTLDQARAAKAAALRRLEKLDTVVGVGITRGDQGYAVKINLREPLGNDVEVPSEIDGVPVRIEVVGQIRKR